MTQTDNSASAYAQYNRKKAYSAMCKASVMLCLFVILSYGFDYVIMTLCFDRYVNLTQAVIVRFFTLIGVPELLAITVSRDILTSEVLYNFLVMLTAMLAMVVPTMFFARSAKLSADDCFSVKGKLIKGFLPTVAFCQLAISSVLKIAYFFSGNFVSPVFGPVLSGRFLSGSTAFADLDIWNLVISVLYMCLFVPFAEEFVFRGVFLSYLKKYGIAFGVVASSILFGFAHSDPVQATFAFGFGLMSAFLAVVTGNIKTSVICHALNNFLYVIEMYTLNTDAFVAVTTVKAIIYALGFVGLYYLVRQGGHMDVFSGKLEENDGHLAIKPGMKEVFCPPMIAFVIFYIAVFVAGMIG